MKLYDASTDDYDVYVWYSNNQDPTGALLDNIVGSF